MTVKKLVGYPLREPKFCAVGGCNKPRETGYICFQHAIDTGVGTYPYPRQ